jgi:hypothetical protein
MIHKRVKIFVNYILGPVLFVWLILAIYRQVHDQKNLYSTWQTMFNSFHSTEWVLLSLVLLLMLVNWGIEAKKWQIQIKRLEQVSFLRSYRAVFTGQAFGFASLNGVGEYAGRAFFMKEGNRIRSVAVTMVGSLSQLIVTFMMGILGLLYFKFFIPFPVNNIIGFNVLWMNILVCIVSIFTVLLLVMFYNMRLVTKTLERIPIVAKYFYFIQKVEEIGVKELTGILVLSLIRYAVFVLQYLLLLKVFKVDALLWQSASMVTVLFLLLTIIPTVTLAELGIRGELSIQLFGLISSNIVGILFSATGIWFINRVIPALAGSLFILGIRLFKK